MSNSNESIDALKKALGADPGELQKSFTQATGLVNYDLQAPAKLLYPVITPLRNTIPRVKGNGGTATNWRSITNVNSANAVGVVGEGNRGGVTSTSVTTVTASYKTLGLDDFVTYEADSAAEGFDDAKARAVQGLLYATFMQEERFLLGGNTSIAMGTTPTPTLATATTGGTIPAATYNVACVALTHQAWKNASVSASGVPVSATRINADGSTDTIKGGAAQKSATASQATTGSTSTVSASVTAVTGAAAYAWYIGTAAAEKLVAITTINSVLITALPAVGNQALSALPSADNSQETLAFDGLSSQILTSGSGAYTVNLATGTAGTGTTLTSNGAGGITEIDTALSSFWANAKLSPDEIWVSGKMFQKMNKLMLANGASPLVRFTDSAVASGNSVSDLLLSRRVAQYQNPITGVLLAINVHPDMPDSWIMFRSTKLPYMVSNVANPLEVKTRRDYYQIQYPIRSRKYEYGVYVDEVLANYFPPAFGLITNAATGLADGT
jgi:hypothetical protein